MIKLDLKKQELRNKEFNEVLDRYLFGDGHMEAEKYEQMSDFQIEVVQIIKKAKKRNKYEQKSTTKDTR